MGQVKGRGHIVHPVSNRCTSFPFHINPTNHSRNMSNIVFDLEKHTGNFKENLAKNRFPTEFLQNLAKWLALPEGYRYQVL